MSYQKNQLIQIEYAGKFHWAAFLRYREEDERKNWRPECDCWCLIDNDIGERVFDSKTEVQPAPPGSGARTIHCAGAKGLFGK